MLVLKLHQQRALPMLARIPTVRLQSWYTVLSDTGKCGFNVDSYAPGSTCSCALRLRRGRQRMQQETAGELNPAYLNADKQPRLLCSRKVQQRHNRHQCTTLSMLEHRHRSLDQTTILRCSVPAIDSSPPGCHQLRCLNAEHRQHHAHRLGAFQANGASGNCHCEPALQVKRRAVAIPRENTSNSNGHGSASAVDWFMNEQMQLTNGGVNAGDVPPLQLWN